MKGNQGIRWQFPNPADADPEHEAICLGADLSPVTLLDAYSAGVFPMPNDDIGQLCWWSPNPRAVLMPAQVHVSRSLRRSARDFTVTFDVCFEAVMRACADPGRPSGWITEDFIEAYVRLHELGYAHSVEVWTDDHVLAGGLYGVQLGGLFAGESMFHRRTDASKLALVALCQRLHHASGERLIDVQWETPHLRSMGVKTMQRAEYVALLPQLLATHPIDFDASV